jgi:hypothetical protein
VSETELTAGLVEDPREPRGGEHRHFAGRHLCGSLAGLHPGKVNEMVRLSNHLSV